MIRLGLRLTVAGGREAIGRLVLIAAAVAVGVGMLLAVLAGVNAVHAQTSRYAWLNTSAADSKTDTSRADPLWWLQRTDFVNGELIDRVDVAATGPDAPVPPGIPRLPAPGQYYASPALRELVASLPADQLADRFPGHAAGTVGKAALQNPDALLIIVGRTPAQLSTLPHAERVTRISTTTPPIAAAALDLILGVLAAGLLFPVLIFVGTATRLSAARREQRFAAMRLVGAAPRQISVIAAVESTVAATAGTVLGFGLYLALRHPLAAVPFNGAPFYLSDLSLNVLDVLLVALGVPVGAAVAARIALRRVRISPLGVSRRVTPKPPRAWRLAPLLAGVTELSYYAFGGRRPSTSIGQTAAYLTGFLLIMAGLVVAGPWLTMVGSRLLARRSSRPAALIAARRLADNPQAGFRAVSGLILALFVTSSAVGIITTIVAHRGTHEYSASGSTVLSMQFDRTAPAGPTGAAAVGADLRAQQGVQKVTVLRANRWFDPDIPTVIPARTSGQLEPRRLDYRTIDALVACADLTPAQGRCAPGAQVAAAWSSDLAGWGTTAAHTVWPTAPLTTAQLARQPVTAILADTDGSHAAIERARTRLETAYPGQLPPGTMDEGNGDLRHALAGWRQLANVVILTSLPIAGCSLAVSVAGGLAERRRPFSLLRLTGMPLRMLRRVVALESAVPLLTVAVVAIGAGFLAAHLFLRAQLQYALHAPGPAYYLIVAAGLGGSLAIIASTLPLLARITGPEAARND